MPPPVLTTLEAYTSASYFTQRLAAVLLSILASLALFLSAIGLYSVIAYGVARCRREIGVRMALGATRGGILRLVVRACRLAPASPSAWRSRSRWRARSVRCCSASGRSTQPH